MSKAESTSRSCERRNVGVGGGVSMRLAGSVCWVAHC